MRSAVFLLTAVFCLVSCSSVADRKYEGDSVENPDYSGFVAVADGMLKKKGFSGAVLVAKGKDVIFAKGYGSSDRRNPAAPPVTMNSVFETGSITKQMTAAAVLQLRDRKLLSLEDKIGKFFEGYRYGDKITVKMLLTMRSGLTDYINSPDDFFPPAVNAEIRRKERACLPLERDIVLKNFYDAPLVTEPGRTYFYCNTDYYLLAMIIEKVSGMSYEDYIRRNIFEKCGMASSNVEFQGTDTKGYDSASLYYSIPESLALGCSSVNSNVIDLFRWNTALASGRVIRKKSFREMTESRSYGYGVYRFEDSILHGGVTDVFNSYNVYYIDEKVSIIVLSNCPVYECNATVFAGILRKLYLSHAAPSFSQED